MLTSRLIDHLTLSQTHEVGNIGILANFELPKISRNPSLFATTDTSKCKIRYQGVDEDYTSW